MVSKIIAPVYEKFASITPKLADADTTAKVRGADATEARNERSVLAASAILSAHSEKLSAETVREALANAGVLKGTVSKITTVVTALAEGKITVDEVKSLNGAYTIVANLGKASKAASTAAVTTGVAVKATAGVLNDGSGKSATTPQEALDLIIGTVRNEKNLDKAYKLGGDWTRKITDAIADVLREKEAAEEADQK